jgi:hypothetical protein
MTKTFIVGKPEIVGSRSVLVQFKFMYSLLAHTKESFSPKNAS